MAGRIEEQRDNDIRDSMRSSYDRQMGMSPTVNFSSAPARPRDDDGPKMSVPTPSPVRQGIKAVFGDVDVGRTVGTGDNERLVRDPNNPYQKFMETQRKNFDTSFMFSPVGAFLKEVFGDKNQMTTKADKITGQIFRQAAANPGTVNLKDDGLGMTIDTPRGQINLSKRGVATYSGVQDPDYDGVFKEIVNPPIEEGDERVEEAKTPLDPCPEGYVYNAETESCVKVETEQVIDDEPVFRRNPTPISDSFPDLTRYGRDGGEYLFYETMPGVADPMKQGGPPRGPQGEVRGPGGPKDDLVGPFMLSSQEYVLPYEMVLDEGGGNYNAGIKSLERQRMQALKKYKDRVASS